MEISQYKSSGKTKNKMGGCCPEGHIRDARNTRMEETSRRERRMEVSSEGGQGPEGGVVPQMDGYPFGAGIIFLILAHSVYKM